MNKLKSLRIFLTDRCTFNCDYCCNKLPEVQAKIQLKTEKEIAEMIESKVYTDVCLTGGEPMYMPKEVGYFNAVAKRAWKRVFLYTDGIALSKGILKQLKLDGINIGVHRDYQIRMILESIPNILTYKNIRFCVEDVNRYDFARNIPDKYIKEWVRDDCFRHFETEDFVKLIDY